MKHLKKIRSIALCVFLALSLSACSKEAKQSNPLPKDSAASADFAVSESAPEEGGKDTIECQPMKFPFLALRLTAPQPLARRENPKWLRRMKSIIL